jgi:hypothetical protein
MHDDVTKFIEAFRDSLSHGPSALTAFYAEPSERALAESDAADRARGFTHAELRALDVQPLGSDSALATVRWAYKGACDELLWTATVSYKLDRRDGAWKILVQTQQDAPPHR